MANQDTFDAFAWAMHNRGKKPKSIFDLIKEQYDIHNERKAPSATIHYTGLLHKFNVNRLRKDLKIEQRIIAYRFIIALDNAKELTTHDLIL